MRGIVPMEDNKAQSQNVSSEYCMKNLYFPEEYLSKRDNVYRIRHFLLNKISLSINRRWTNSKTDASYATPWLTYVVNSRENSINFEIKLLK